jgi:aryl-alcohol dehydrogenase-like predicted oxidoreductase
VNGGAARLALGTVQFGLAYGATHSGGRVADDEARHILDVAQSAGIDTLDTAAAYGDAEAVLGRTLSDRQFKIVSKTLPAGSSAPNPTELNRIDGRFRRSLAFLGASAIDAILVHAAGDILGPGGEGLWRRLEHWRAKGLVRRIGVSVYDEAEVLEVLKRYQPDLVQLPMNVLDQRLLACGAVARLHERGVAIHVRSAFLQGLLLTSAGQTPARLAPLEPCLARWRKACAAADIAPAVAALSFVADIEGVERVVVGVQSAAQLRELVAAADAPSPAIAWADLAVADAGLLDPRTWPGE